MEIKKVVDLDTLTPEEQEALDNGLKTEDDLLAEHEEAQKALETERESRLTKAEEIAENQRIRAEKAEARAREDLKEVAPNTDALSQKDLIAILKADVAEDDIPEVVDYARLKKISVVEALKSSVVKTILSEKNEERKTASATATGGHRKGPSRVSPSQLLADAEKGVMPEDDEGITALVKARKGIS
jgi:hypothetical protein